MCPQDKPPRMTADQQKKARLAEALRANLKRRRAQTKRRATSENESGEAELAVNPPQSPATGVEPGEK